MRIDRSKLPSAPDVATRRRMVVAFKEHAGFDGGDACATVIWSIQAGFMVFDGGQARLTKEGYDYEEASGCEAAA